MNQLTHNRATRAGTVIGFLAMAFLGWRLAEPPHLATPRQEENRNVRTRPVRREGRSGPPDAVRRRMASLRAMGSPQERMRATIELANNLPDSEIPAWLDGRWFYTGDGYDLMIFTRIAKERWDKKDPHEAFLSTFKSGFAWRTKKERQQSGTMLLANKRFRAEEKIESPADWLEKASAAGVNPGNLDRYLWLLCEWTPDEITWLGNQFSSMSGDGKNQIAQVITSARGLYQDLDPALVGAAFCHVLTQPRGPEDSKLNHLKDPLSKALEFAVRWSTTDPIAASKWVETLPASDAKLWVEKTLATSWAQYDPKAVDQWVKSLPASVQADLKKPE